MIITESGDLIIYSGSFFLYKHGGNIIDESFVIQQMQTNFGRTVSQPYFCAGELAERSIAAVLKTVEVQASWGSNP
jgi:hypothetical protein